jgi:hypothetical protein
MKGIIVTSSNQKKEIVPAGTHFARCYSMIHIGVVEWEFQGEKKFNNKVRLTWELPYEMRDFGGEQKPLVISKEYTLSMHEKSNLRKDLEMWRGKVFTNKELGSFDVTDLLGKTCNLSVIHKVAKNGNEFAQVGGVSAIQKGVEVLEQFNPTFIFNYGDHFDLDWLDSQPEWIQEQIKSSEDYIYKINAINLLDNQSKPF